jgi:hypothetical protein
MASLWLFAMGFSVMESAILGTIIAALMSLTMIAAVMFIVITLIAGGLFFGLYLLEVITTVF